MYIFEMLGGFFSHVSGNNDNNSNNNNKNSPPNTN